MKLSIIMPVFNGAAFLDRSLSCLLEQTLEDDYEIIVVNDGSTDSSQTVIDRYADENPGIIKSLIIDNGGQGRARNFGLDIAEGEFIGFADADDYVSPEMYRRLLEAVENENADIAVCDFYRFTNNSQHYEKAAMQKHRLSAAGAVWNKVFRRELIGDIRFPSGLWYEDLEFSAKVMLKAEKIVYINEAFYYYRSDNESTMRNRNAEKNLDILKVFDHILESVDSSNKQDFEFLLINHVLLESVKRVDEIGDQAVVDELRAYVKKHIPNLLKCSSFNKETVNRRIIMTLNYVGLNDFSKKILCVKR